MIEFTWKETTVLIPKRMVSHVSKDCESITIYLVCGLKYVLGYSPDELITCWDRICNIMEDNDE